MNWKELLGIISVENLGKFILNFEIDEEENKIVNVSARLSSDT